MQIDQNDFFKINIEPEAANKKINEILKYNISERDVNILEHNYRIK
jgi:hypothetical protein